MVVLVQLVGAIGPGGGGGGWGVVFFQAEDGIRYLVRSRGLGDVYKRQRLASVTVSIADEQSGIFNSMFRENRVRVSTSFGLSLIHI